MSSRRNSAWSPLWPAAHICAARPTSRLAASGVARCAAYRAAWGSTAVRSSVSERSCSLRPWVAMRQRITCGSNRFHSEGAQDQGADAAAGGDHPHRREHAEGLTHH